MEPAGRHNSGPRPGAGSVKPVGVALQQLIDGLGIAPTIKQYDVLRLWGSIVGEQIARVTEAQRMEKGVLFVRVASAPWRAELAMKRMEIMQKINATLGERVVNEIRFR
jgi:predicted nucleic acid-binding Zn ribbon protein